MVYAQSSRRVARFCLVLDAMVAWATANRGKHAVLFCADDERREFVFSQVARRVDPEIMATRSGDTITLPNAATITVTVPTPDINLRGIPVGVEQPWCER